MPTKRTFMKFGRGLAFAAVGSALLFVTDHLADIGLPPALYAAAVPLVAFAFRYFRGLAGNEPT